MMGPCFLPYDVNAMKVRSVGNIEPLLDINSRISTCLSNDLALVDTGIVSKRCYLLVCTYGLSELLEIPDHILAVECLLLFHAHHDNSRVFADPTANNDGNSSAVFALIR